MPTYNTHVSRPANHEGSSLVGLPPDSLGWFDTADALRTAWHVSSSDTTQLTLYYVDPEIGDAMTTIAGWVMSREQAMDLARLIARHFQIGDLG